jgi:putative ATPase
MSDVREGRTQPVPRELISGMKKGRAPDAADYRSPHTAADGVGTTDYLGVERVFYEPTERGAEAGQAERLDAVRSRRRADRDRGDDR